MASGKTFLAIIFRAGSFHFKILLFNTIKDVLLSSSMQMVIFYGHIKIHFFLLLPKDNIIAFTLRIKSKM